MSFVNDTDMRGSARLRNKIITAVQANAQLIQPRMRAQWAMNEDDFPTIDNYDNAEPRDFSNNQKHCLVSLSIGSANEVRIVD